MAVYEQEIYNDIFFDIEHSTQSIQLQGKDENNSWVCNLSINACNEQDLEGYFKVGSVKRHDDYHHRGLYFAMLDLITEYASKHFDDFQGIISHGGSCRSDLADAIWKQLAFSYGNVELVREKKIRGKDNKNELDYVFHPL